MREMKTYLACGCGGDSLWGNEKCHIHGRSKRVQFPGKYLSFSFLLFDATRDYMRVMLMSLQDEDGNTPVHLVPNEDSLIAILKPNTDLIMTNKVNLMLTHN